jgi:hypothetical protein
MGPTLNGLLVSLALLAFSRISAAAPPELSAAALGGLALLDVPWAFGARAGVSFLERGYAGATFMLHPPNLYGESNGTLWYTGAEAGFEVGDFPKTRFFVGAGYAHRRRSYGGGAPEGVVFVPPPARGSLALWPGVAFLFPIAPAFVGLDLRLLLWTRVQSSSEIPIIPAISLTAGVNF